MDEIMRKFLVSVLVVLGHFLLVTGSAWGHGVDWRKQHSESTNELVVPKGASLSAYQSPEALFPETRVVVLPCSKQPCRLMIRISGVLDSSLMEKMNAALSDFPDVKGGLLVLDSAGGKAGAGLGLAEWVAMKEWDTQVEDGGTCLSACVYALSAGRIRTVGAWALVGVHQLNITQKYVETSHGLPEKESVDERLDRLDLEAQAIQSLDRRWLLGLVRANVSPILMVYALGAVSSRKESFMFLVNSTCARALNLDNRFNEPAKTLNEVALRCE
jgi:hypothetical protein